MRSRYVLSLILSLLLVAALSVSSRAQAVHGSVFGTVTDPQGARVVGAVVTVTDLTKNVTTSAQTNESGNYTVTHLIPGTYSLKVEHQGYKIIIQEVEVKADVAARTDFALEIETLTEQITVTTETQRGSLKTDRADVATNLNQQQIEDLPLIATSPNSSCSLLAHSNSSGNMLRARTHKARSRSSLMGSNSAELLSSLMALTIAIRSWASSSSTPRLNPSPRLRSPLRTMTQSLAWLSLEWWRSKRSPEPMRYTGAHSCSDATTRRVRATLSHNHSGIRSRENSFPIRCGTSSAALWVGRSGRTRTSSSATIKAPAVRTEDQS